MSGLNLHVSMHFVFRTCLHCASCASPGLLPCFGSRLSKRSVLSLRITELPRFGYTAFALQQLKRPKGVQKSNGLKQLGGPQGVPPLELQRCKDRMAAWAAATLELIHAEFPQFEVLMAFQVFSLRKESWLQKGAAGLSAEEHKSKCLERLAKTFDLDFVAVHSQFDTHLHVAKTRFDETNCSSLDAWAFAVSATRKHHMTKNTFKSDELHKLLCQALVHGGATSGVEQNFSKLVWTSVTTGVRKHVFEFTTLKPSTDEQEKDV